MKAVAAILAIMLYSAGAGGVKMFPEGVRLNNPCNIRHSHDKWNGESRFQNDKRFVRFSTPQAGLRAAMKTLLTYEDIHGLTTVAKIVHRWAPPVENNTESYTMDVSRHLGVTPNTFIDIHQPELLMALTQAIVIHENGYPPAGMPSKWYEEVTYHDAAIQALDDSEE